MLLGDVAATLTRQQATLQAAIDDLASLAAEKKVALDDLSRSLAELAAARAELTAQLSARTRPAPREADRLLAKALAEAGATLSDLALLLDRLSPDTAEIAVQRALFDEAVGTLPLPVLGDAVAEGNTVVIAAEAYALARAPWLSTVRHAGAVGLLGGVLVLEPAPGVLISLRGLGAIERQTAEIVGVGEPLGHMGGAVPATEEFLIAATDSAAVAPPRRLYIDMWRDGQAEQAAAWFGLEQ
jgi:septal ring factor EnvC (AmiA/AmiB activator)